MSINVRIFFNYLTLESILFILQYSLPFLLFFLFIFTLFFNFLQRELTDRKKREEEEKAKKEAERKQREIEEKRKEEELERRKKEEELERRKKEEEKKQKEEQERLKKVEEEKKRVWELEERQKRADLGTLLAGLHINAKTIDTLVQYEILTAPALVTASVDDLKQLGISPGQALEIKSRFNTGSSSSDNAPRPPTGGAAVCCFRY